MEMALGKRGPQAIRAIFPNGSGAEWLEDGQPVTGQIWTEGPGDHAVWLAVQQGQFPGEMRLAKHLKGTITGVDPTVYNCHGESASDHADAATECVQGELFKYEAPEPPPLETLPLF